MNKRLLSLCLAFIVSNLSCHLSAIDLTTYYSNANNKKAADLKTAMKSVISNHTKLSYGSLWTYYEQVDYIESNGKMRVFDYYSDAIAYFPEPSTMNKEHTVPQSWWGGGTGEAQGSDLFHVLPSEKNANSAKGSYPLGIVTGTVSYPSKGVTNTRMKTGKDKNNKMVFEPCDEYKGDFARIYMYVATCYSNINWQRQSDLGCVLQKEDYPTFISQDFIKMLLQWNRQDPVSEWERTRNERVYAVQKNRNPFVDYPSLCEYIWGDSVNYAFNVSLPHEMGTGGEPPVDPVDPVNPVDPVDPDNPAISGSIDLTQLTWASDTHDTYGQGFTATSNGLTIGYYKNNSQTDPRQVGSELRLYKNSVFIVTGAKLVGVTIHAVSSYAKALTIDGQEYTFDSNLTLSWTGETETFEAFANAAQTRFTSIDVTVLEPEPEPEPEPDWSQVYCRSVQGLNQSQLKTALHDIIQPRQVLNYGKGEGYTWSGFAVTDVMPDGSVRDRYSDVRREFNGMSSVAGMNIEHIWANSWWGHTVNNAYCDLFNLYPADAEANQRKNNNPIGIVDGAVSYDNDVTKVGKSSSYSTDQLITAWEPADEWKGDFARTYFYMATTYQHMTDEWQTTEGLQTIDPASWTTMRPWVYELMLSWAADDPVDDIERERNEAIYAIQGNRNPYVDYPELADYVWGNRNNEIFYIDPSSTTPEIFVPVKNPGIDFGLQALSLGMNRRVMVRGRNLPEGLTATIEGEGFAMQDADLTAAEVTAGTPLIITSTATAGGVYEATLVLRSEDLFEQRTPITMTVIDGVPAYPARDITCSVYKRSFTATWMKMPLTGDEHYTIDVYTKDTEGTRHSFTGYPVELTDTFCVVSNPAALTTYYYEIQTSGGLISNEVQVDMPAIKPVFSSSAYEMLFTTVPGKASQSQSVKLTVQGISGYTVAVACPAPFEISLDGETWTHELALDASALEFQVRLGSAEEEGSFEEEMTILLPDVKELVVSLTAFVDASKAFFESFEQGAKGSYAEASVACNAASWLMTDALISSTEAFRNDNRSVRMKTGGSITMQEDKPNGCDSLWFYAGLYNKDTGAKLTVSYTLDGGSTWTPVVNDLAFTNGEWKRYGYEIRRDGLLRLKFEASGNKDKRINIDDVQMSNYGTLDAVPSIEKAASSDVMAVYTLDGRYVGSVIPARRGIYIVRQGNRVMKVKN